MSMKSTSHTVVLVAFTLLASCANDSGLLSQGGGGSSGTAEGGTGGLGTRGGGGSTGGVTGRGGTTPVAGALSGGGSGPSGGRAGSGGAITITGGTRSGSGGVAGGAGNSAGGVGGRSGGTGGATICPTIACLLAECVYGTLPSASPCGCPPCAPPPDAGAAFDAPTVDAHQADSPAVCTAACIRPNCPNGTVKGPPPCNCPVCPSIDAGQLADGPVDAGEGAGAACGAASDPTCASGTHCEWSDKLCGARTHGACVSFPGGAACPVLAVPVCGCDGKNYPSPCEAARAGVDISSNTSCPEPTDMFRCGWSYCQHNLQYCYAQVGGAVTNPGSYACNALPAVCGGVPSCACVAGSATICNTNAKGDVTSTLEVP